MTNFAIPWVVESFFCRWSFNEKVVQFPQSDMLLCTDTLMGCFLFINKFLSNDSV